MSGARRLLLMVLVGILIAASIIGGVTALENGKLITTPTSQTRTLISNTTVTTSTTIVSSTIQTGVLAAQITDPPDPPNIPVGITHVYIYYNDIEAHTTFQNNSVWVNVAKGGVVDILSVLNLSRTLGSAQVPSGTYDQVRFSIENATVTFGGANYTASIPMDQIVVSLSNGGTVVQPDSSAGFVLGLTPTVLVSSSSGKQAFQIEAAVQGVSIPSDSWNVSLASPGSFIQDITSQPWWKVATPIGDNLSEVTGTEIYPTTLLVILNNTGRTPITISGMNILSSGASSSNSSNVTTTTIVSTSTTSITITEVSTITKSAVPANPRPPSNSSIETVATFLILSNGSVVQPSPGSTPIPADQIGLTIKPHQDIVLLYLGYISTLYSPNPPYQQLGIVGGQEYTIQIFTPFGASAEFNVYASYTS
ncbi:MAG: DUF4382 domain-containing protein [Nitrososphaerota archaeon]|jgi:hypothetical protein|nr:DUF4382 domain-containing protein [Nitrososphaerota archaeon]